MPNDSPRPDVAVFIDFENVYVSVRDKLDANPNFEMIMDRVEDFGRVVIARAYADVVDGVVADEPAGELPHLVTDTLMDGPDHMRQVARKILDFGRTLEG